MSNEQHVYVVDDDEAMRDSLEFLLEAAGFSIHLYVSALSFMQALTEVDSGCVVTDIRMPVMDGLELLKRVKQEKPSLPVIVMTGHGEVPLAVEAMKAGAADFIEKPFEDTELVDVIRSALSGSERAADNQAATADIEERISSLSRRESQVLEGLVAGLTNKEIALQYAISPRTIEVYRANVMTKMQASNLSELIRLAMRSHIASL